MTYRIIFLDAVDSDINAGTVWYRNIRPGLEDQFKRDLSRIFKQLTDNPRIFREVIPGVRMGITHRFKFRVLYEIRNRDILIAAIVHPKRHDSVWKRRF